MKYDMHIHTQFSDGNFSPKKIIDIASGMDLQGIAITDHDSIGALDQGMKIGENIVDFTVIPGIEFSCLYNSEEVHILAYFIDYKSNLLLNYLKQLKDSRIRRAEDVVFKLNKLNIKIDLHDIDKYKNKENDFIGRVQIAKALVEKRYVNSINDAFEKYLSIHKPAYVPKKSLGVEETINLINQIGGISVLAHPILLKDKMIIDSCKEMGIDGIECIHSKHSKEFTKDLIEYAKQNNLMITGGSDCHGFYLEEGLLMGKYYCEIKKGDKLYDYLQR